MSPQKETWPQYHSERTYLYPFSATFANKCRIFKEHCGKKTKHRGQTSALKSEAKFCPVIKCAGPGAAGPTGVELRVKQICAACCCCYWATCPTTTLCITAQLWQNLVFASTAGLTITWEHEGAPFTHRCERLNSNSRMQPPAGVKRENRLTSNAKSTEGRKNHEGMSITHWYTPLRCPHSPCQDPHDAVWPRGPSIAH